MDERSPLVTKTTACLPCTCGELFQGTLEGELCLVSCPIAIYSCAGVDTELPNPTPPGRKTRQALDILRKSWPRQSQMWVRTPLPVGRGYGTSTADIGAALAAACAADRRELPVQEAARIAVRVEPTDSTLFPGLTLFAHRSGKFCQSLGPAPAAQILIIDPGGFVDTQAFNRHDRRAQLAGLRDAHAHAFEMLREGIENKDVDLIGRAASLSSRLHQRLLFNPLLEKALWLSDQVDAAGVCRAHSGTILGLLLPGERDDLDALIHFGHSHLPAGLDWVRTHLTGGGARFNDLSDAPTIHAESTAEGCR